MQLQLFKLVEGGQLRGFWNEEVEGDQAAHERDYTCTQKVQRSFCIIQGPSSILLVLGQACKMFHVMADKRPPEDSQVCWHKKVSSCTLQ